MPILGELGARKVDETLVELKGVVDCLRADDVGHDRREVARACESGVLV